MKLIVGLGNPGEKYANNRHNVGFMFIDYIAKLLNCSLADNNLTIQQCNNKDDKFILAKPQTYMNLSGVAVKKLMSHDSRLKTHDLIVVHDDLDIPLGKFKIQKGVGPKLHNGIESIEEKLGTKDFLRIRIGVENRTKENYLPGEDYVLSDFTNDEKEIINKLFSEIFNRLLLSI